MSMPTLESTCYGQFCVKCGAIMEWQQVEEKGVQYAAAECCGQRYLFLNRDNTTRIEQFSGGTKSLGLFSILALAAVIVLPVLALVGCFERE